MPIHAPMASPTEDPDATWQRHECEAMTLPLAPPRWSRFAMARRHLLFVLILVLAAYLITINVTSPWQSMHEDNGTLNESIAINHLRYGLGVTKGQDLLDIESKQSFGPQNVSEAQHFTYFLTGPTHPEVYGDHPPLLGLTIAASFIVFGPHFWSERLVPILYALAGLLVFYLLVCRVFDVVVARCAAVLYVTFPLFAYFGRNVSHEAPTLFWALLLLTGYLYSREDRRARWRVLMAVATVIGGAYGWPLYYFAVLLFALDWLWARRPDWSLALITVVPAVATFALVIAQILWAIGGDLSHLTTMFVYRTGGDSADRAAVTTIGWFQQITTWNAEDFGNWSQLALPVALGFVAARQSREGWSPRLRMVTLLGVWGISHVLIFRNGAYVHAYWQFYLLPGVALALAWGAVAGVRQVISRPGARMFALSVACGTAFCLNLGTVIALYSTGYHTMLPVVPLFDLWR